MAREAADGTDEGSAGGADEVQDVVLDQDAEDEALIDAFEQEIQFADQEAEGLRRPKDKKADPKAKAKGAEDDDQDEDEDGADEDDDPDGDEDGEDEAEADAAKAKTKDADEDDDPDGDFVEHEGGKIAVRDLLEAHKFRNEVNSTVDQVRAHLTQQGEKQIGELRTRAEAKVKDLEDAIALVNTLVPKIEKPPATMLDPNSDDYDPDGYHFLMRAAEEFEKALTGAKSKLEDANKGKKASETKAQEAKVADNLRKLVEKVPEFKDPTKAKAFGDDVVKTLKADGFSDEEINGLHDYRMLIILRDAMAHRAAKAKGPPKVDKHRAKPRLVRAAARATPAKGKRGANPTARNAALDRLARTGRVAEADLEATWGDLID